MPIEKRCLSSGAKLFVPTPSERAIHAQARKYKEELEDIQQMKQELQTLIDQAKNNK